MQSANWYVHREAGVVTSVHGTMQPGYAEELLAADSPELLPMHKASKAADAAAAFAAQVNAGMAYGGRILQIRDADRANITGQASRAVAALTPGSGVTWPDGFAWRMADNSALALPTPADMLALGEAASDRYAALRLRFGQLKDAIAQAANAEELDAIDVAAGW